MSRSFKKPKIGVSKQEGEILSVTVEVGHEVKNGDKKI
jgi:pyruvate/2-oxoglutarate dehydrogenase complex dihydrolipoamide acyltransferase (E2) component